jgi:hypothetical protein
MLERWLLDWTAENMSEAFVNRKWLPRGLRIGHEITDMLTIAFILLGGHVLEVEFGLMF